MSLRIRPPLIRGLVWLAGMGILFAGYTSGLSVNPPGFYLDESAIAYNAYLLAHSGVAEFDQRWPLFIHFYTGGYGQPTLIYLLASFFVLVPPSIFAARMFCVFWVFAASLLIGLLARKTSGKKLIGVIVAATALLTPWLFEVSRLVFEATFYPMALALFLLALYRAHRKDDWTFLEVATLAGTLALLTYTYTIGRVLAPMLALGLVSFATGRKRLYGIVKVWSSYAVTLLPLWLWHRRHPGAMTERFYELSYIKSGVPWSEIAFQFVRRYIEDQSMTSLLMTGDAHPRHHVQGAGGAIFFATFILAMIGVLVIVLRRRGDPWWRYVVFGLAASIVPGAITIEPVHALRLIAYPIFLLLATIPAIEWLLGPEAQEAAHTAAVTNGDDVIRRRTGDGGRVVIRDLPRLTRLWILVFLIALTAIEAAYFQSVFRREGPHRSWDFDAPYKQAYDAAIAQPARPIYLEDGYWGPAYINAYWYATVENRPTSEFVHLPPGARPPAGAFVISSQQACQNCEIIKTYGIYLLYRAK